MSKAVAAGAGAVLLLMLAGGKRKGAPPPGLPAGSGSGGGGGGGFGGGGASGTWGGGGASGTTTSPGQPQPSGGASGTTTSPGQPQPSSGGHMPSTAPDALLQRMAQALASGDIELMEAVAGELNRLGYNMEAEQLLAAAELLRKAGTPAAPSTPAPSTPAPSTPAPSGGIVVNPDTWPQLKQGSTGQHVREWQQVLNRDGFPVEVDGKFGPATTAATKAWQKKNRLDPDGIVGPAVRARIDDGSPTEIERLPLQIPIPPVLQLGSRGPAVEDWQAKLRAVGFGVGKNAAAVELFTAIPGADPEVQVDGVFGANTERATRLFQTDHRLPVDGKVGDQTRAAVGRLALIGARLLRLGSRGPAVQVWQQQLARDGATQIVADGMFGAVTRTATMDWQRARGIEPDGAVGPKTIAAVNVTAPRGPVTGPTIVDPDKWRLMRRGTAGADVAEWQLVLNRDGYGPLEADGKFGPATEQATKRWQKAHALDPDGVVGPAVRDAIHDGAPDAPVMRATRVLKRDAVQGDTQPIRAPREFRPSTPLPGLIAPAIPDEVVPADRALAAKFAAHIFNVRPGKEDPEFVSMFQRAHGLNATGRYGAATALALVPYGIVPAKPFVWPAKGSMRAKAQYRITLMEQSKRDPQRADEWAAAANVDGRNRS